MFGFFQQLWARSVIQFGVLYLGAAWLLLQAAAVLETTLELPDWFDQMAFALLLLGFPLVLILAWAQNSQSEPHAGRKRKTRKRGETSTRTLAVLPFNNFSSDPEQEHFADSLTEDLITELSKTDQLNVIARNSSFAFKGQSVDVRDAGARLDADLVLEGSLRKAQNAIRYTAQLIDCGTGHHIWANRDDLTIVDPLKTQDEISSAIVKSVREAIRPGNAERAEAENPKAADRVPKNQKVYRFDDLMAPGPHKTQYALSDGLQIAYNVRGEGPPNIVMAPGIISHLHLSENMPTFARPMKLLSEFSRLLTFDKRGQGLSDPTNAAPSLEERIDDIRAVMDDAGMDKAFLYGLSEGGPMSILFAATYPDRVQGLILVGSTARFSYADDYQIGTPRKAIMALAELWGEGKLRSMFFPTIGEDVLSNDVYRAVEQISASNRNVRHLCEMMADMDVRDILPTIRVPTLVVHFTGDLAVPSRMGRYMADHIPNAEFLEVAGADHGDIANAPEAIERIRSFCNEVMANEQADRSDEVEEILATVVHISSNGAIPQDIVLAAAREFQATIAEHDNEKSATLAFDGPTRAVRCALSILSSLNNEATVSAHSGLVVRHNGSLDGPAVQRALELNGKIKPGAVFATGTLRDLLLRSGLDIRSVDVAPPGFTRLATVSAPT